MAFRTRQQAATIYSVALLTACLVAFPAPCHLKSPKSDASQQIFTHHAGPSGSSGHGAPLLEDGERRAYVTLVTTSQYAIGAQVLARSLRHTGTPYPIVAMVGDLVPQAVRLQLQEEGLEVMVIQDDVRTPSVSVRAQFRGVWPSSLGVPHILFIKNISSFSHIIREP
jgi:hypothetical protein